jgi:hypothetical protein
MEIVDHTLFSSADSARKLGPAVALRLEIEMREKVPTET